MDFCVRVPSLPQRGETVLASSVSRSLGGKGANQATALRRLGGEVAIVTCVGGDDFGAAFLHLFAEEGIEAGFVHRDRSVPTGIRPVFLNPAPFVEAAPQLVRSADVLIPNQVEAEALTGLPIRTPEDALRAAERLRGMGPSCVIVTLGEQGAVLSGPGLTGLSLALAAMASAQGPTDLFLGTKRLPTGGGISAAA